LAILAVFARVIPINTGSGIIAGHRTRVTALAFFFQTP
jgi:hypothetical protein